MHIRKEDMKTSVRENMRGGKGKIISREFLPLEDAANCGRVFSVFTLNPGCSIGYHDHEGEFEIYYITKGTATIVDDGETYTLSEGDMMQCRNHHSHSIENCTDNPVEFIALVIFDRTEN